MSERNSIPLTGADRERLLQIARAAVETHLDSNRQPPSVEESPGLAQDGSAFVTLHKDGQLRGCVGTLANSHALHETVAAMAIAAAMRDPRFPPLRLEELQDTTIEISVLSESQPIRHTDEIRIGVHGLTIELDGHRGLLLPQVASERGWTVDSYLQQLCRKANLPEDSWLHPHAQVSRFTADVFQESAGC